MTDKAEDKKVNKKEVSVAQTDTAKPQLRIDDRGVETGAYDFWAFSITPEEIMLKFGDTRQSKPGSIKIDKQIAMSYYTAKRLQSALIETIKRYDNALSSINVEAPKV